MYTRSAPQPPQPPHRLRQVCDLLFLCRDFMADSSGQPTGAARRRRQRRLRSILRHEQQTVRMALAAALHHSAGPKEKVEMQQYGALRGQKTAARAGEEVVHDAHDALRGQKTPPPGVRPGSLSDPGPQRSDRTVRRSSGEAPLLTAPMLADAAAEAVDARTVRYLLIELAIEEARVALEPSRGSKRKRKKRRKRKLPKGGCRLFPPGCGRLCDLQQQVPAVQVVHVLEGAPASVHRQSGGHSCFACRDVYPQCELCRRLSSLYRCCSWTVPPPDIGGVGFGSSPILDTKHTIYELCLPSERGCPDSAAPMCCGGVCVAMSCGGGGFPPDGAYDSAWYSVRPMTGKYFINYFQYQEVVGCVCMLNGWFSNNDDICADNYISSRFKLKDICRSEKWELYLYGDKIIKVDRDRVEVLPRVCLRLGSSPNLATGHTPSLSCAAS